MKRIRILALSVAAAALTFGSVRADMVTYSFTDIASGKSASAEFTLSGSQLVMVVTNTGSGANQNTDTLGGIFLNLGTPSSLTSADTIALTSGSHVVVNGSNASSQSVNGQWFLASDTSDHAGYNTLVGSVGYNSGSKDYFGTGSGDNGINYGLINGYGASPNNGFYKKDWISSSVTLNLTVASSFKLSDLGSHILFQYGSSHTEPSFVSDHMTFGGQGGRAVPEPTSLALLIFGGAAGLWMSRRRRKALHGEKPAS